MAAGLFLDDLYRRLNAVRLSVPPLRERRDDIPSLVDHFAGEFVGVRVAEYPAPNARPFAALNGRATWAN